jgi:glycosyltransferase involved in cell wall biosynthesis
MNEPAQSPARRIRVALYYPWLYLTSGAERTILRLIEHSRHDWVLLTNHFDPANTYPEFSTCEIVELPPISVDRTVSDTAKTCLRLMRQKLPLEGVDALVVVCEGVGDLVLFRNSSTPALCLCLTPLRIAFDEVYRERWAEAFSPVKRFAVWAGSIVFRAVDRLAWRHYSRRFCISSEVKRRIVKGGLASADEVEVIYPALGVQPERADAEYGDFFLLPGRIMWTKNIELGIDAFREFRRLRPELGRFRLIVAGIVDRKSQSYYEKLQALAWGVEGIEFRMHPSDAELKELYRTCRATLFTAFNEDYGIVPLEGMAYGKPTIAVNRGGPRDTVQHGIQGFLEEPEASAFARRMVEVAASPELCRTLGQAALVHARTFNWNEFSKRIDDALESLVSSPAGSSNPAGMAGSESGRPACAAS